MDMAVHGAAIGQIESETSDNSVVSTNRLTIRDHLGRITCCLMQDQLRNTSSLFLIPLALMHVPVVSLVIGVRSLVPSLESLAHSFDWPHRCLFLY